ncbi:MAG: glycoside hydrolase family 43 protein [Clostridia bacterium]|nr:glycoside hydrolase family 43 protein [Clostridia bacterium]
MAYLFVHFTVEKLGGEQVYFSISRDGLHWQDLHQEQPVLRSNLGEKGVRDPFIVQHPLNGRYHLIATDLCIQARQEDWYGAVHHGSRNVIIWDSDDLIHWSAPRAVPISPEGAGCTWAPEAVWDAKRQAFLVFFACHTGEGAEARHRIWAAHTTDFSVFTPPFPYIEREKGIIDTTIIRENGLYYRFSKDETTSRIRVDKGAELLGNFDPVDCPVLDALPGLEGPECYQLPDGRWCLICDQFRVRKGYLPIIIDDLSAMALHPLQPQEYDLGRVLKRHGGVLRIEDDAYDRLIAHYGL